MSSPSFLVRSNLSARFLSEEFGDYFLRIAFNYQSLLLRSRFTLWALRFCLLGHLELLSHWFSVEVKGVPQPGIEPGRPFGSRECKSRLSTSSSTGACSRKALNVGAVMPLKTSPVPTFFGPTSAALLPSSFSCSTPSNSCDDGKQVSGNLPRFRNPGISQSIAPTSALTDHDYVAAAAQLIKQTINTVDCQATSSADSLRDFRTRDRVILSQYLLAVQQQQKCWCRSREKWEWSFN